MLMDILMEALMNMDDESLDYVLESCDAEELEIISDAMEARYEDGPTKVADKSAMKTKYLERRSASKNNSPVNYNFDFKLYDHVAGRGAAQSIRRGNELIDAKTGPNKIYTEQQAKDKKEANKKQVMDFVMSARKYAKAPFDPEGYDPRAILRRQAKNAHPDNKSKQADFMREYNKARINDSAKFFRNEG